MHGSTSLKTVSVVINTSVYNRNVGAFLGEPAWRRLANDTTETVEIRTELKKLAPGEEVSFYLVIIQQSSQHNTWKSKIPKMRWHACGSFLVWNKLNPTQLVQSKDVSVWCNKTHQQFLSSLTSSYLHGWVTVHSRAVKPLLIGFQGTARLRDRLSSKSAWLYITGRTTCCWRESVLLWCAVMWCAEVWGVTIKTLLQDSFYLLLQTKVYICAWI